MCTSASAVSERASCEPIPDQESLAEAFISFTQAANSLQRSYAQLQAEIGRLHAQLEQANSELEKERESSRKSQALAEISAMLAHEIRNPLGSMELFASLLADAKLSRSEKEWIRHIQAGLRMLAATVNNVLQFHADACTNLLATDMGEFLDSAYTFVAPLAEQAGVQLMLENHLRGVHVYADSQGLQQVILNLALNALQAVPPGGKVVLAGQCVSLTDQSWVQLEVTDNGKGASEEQLERLFQPGFTTRPGHAGLGLTVCRKLMAQHHGDIYLSSKPGRGTTCRLRIPGVAA